MRRADYPGSVGRLIAQFKRLPGIGPRSAERIALWIIESPGDRGTALAAAIGETAARVKPCPLCGFFSEDGACAICDDPSRGGDILCVVERATDILPIERTGGFRGHYHALGGRISPLDNVSPENLRIDSLLRRIESGGYREVILALSADVEGEATASYLAELLRRFRVHVTRIAQGLPAGGGIDQADEVTVSRALANRRAF